MPPRERAALLAIAIGSLVTRCRLGQWGYLTTAGCEFCSHMDTVGHRLVECQHPEAVLAKGLLE